MRAIPVSQPPRVGSRHAVAAPAWMVPDRWAPLSLVGLLAIWGIHLTGVRDVDCGDGSPSCPGEVLSGAGSRRRPQTWARPGPHRGRRTPPAACRCVCARRERRVSFTDRPGRATARGSSGYMDTPERRLSDAARLCRAKSRGPLHVHATLQVRPVDHEPTAVPRSHLRPSRSRRCAPARSPGCSRSPCREPRPTSPTSPP